MSWICPQPFRYIYPSNYGWKPCCRESWFPAENKPIMEWWTKDENLNTMRRDMISGELSEFTKKVCDGCIKREEQGGQSYRTNIENYMDDATMDTILDFAETGEMKLQHKNLIYKMRIGDQCNLSCYMCDPINSTTRRKEIEQLPPDYFPLPEKEEMDSVVGMIEVGPYISSLFLSGGEPLYSKRTYEVLDLLIDGGWAKDINIHISTNLTRIRPFMKRFYNEFASISLSVSVDDLFERNDWLRHGSHFIEIIRNLNWLRDGSVGHCIHPSWSMLNVLNARQILHFFRDKMLNPNLNLVDQPTYLHPKNLPDKAKEELIDDLSRSDNEMIQELILYIGMEREEEQWRKGLDYCDELDKLRGTNFREIFKNAYTDFTYG